MSIRICLAAAIAITAAPAFAQGAPAGQEAVQQAAQAFGQCVGAGVQGADAALAPEAAAAAVLGACAAERAALEQAVESVLAAAPEEQRVAGRDQFRTQMAQAEGQIADAIRRQRAAPAAPAQ